MEQKGSGKLHTHTHTQIAADAAAAAALSHSAAAVWMDIAPDDFLPFPYIADPSERVQVTCRRSLVSTSRKTGLGSRMSLPSSAKVDRKPDDVQ